MDQPIQKRVSPFRRWILYIAALAAILSIGLAYVLFGNRNSNSASDILTATVTRGDFSVTVRGVGHLAPRTERWITSRAPGVVEEVLALPGHKVEIQSEIVRLANPTLHGEVAQAILALEESNADYRVLLAKHTDNRLSAEANIASSEAAYQDLSLRLAAEKKLLEKNIVSELEYRRTLIATDQARTFLDIETTRLNQLEETASAERAASSARIANREIQLRQARDKLAALTIRAELNGIVMDVLVQLGQKLDIGDGVARIANVDSLVGVVRIPEAYASRLAIGQHAVVSILNENVDATVVRVDPTVTSGNVVVDLEIEDDLPLGARPDLSVNAIVTVAELNNTLFVRRPINVFDDTTTNVFLTNPERSNARRTAVRFGIGTLDQVQVLNGLSEGDIILIDNSARSTDADSIPLN